MFTQIYKSLLANKEFPIDPVLCNLPWARYSMLVTVCKEILRVPCSTVKEDLNLPRKPTMFRPHSCFWTPLNMASNVFTTVFLSGFHEVFELFINLVYSHQKLGLGKSIKIVAYR
jgi:hypothetical protein